MFELINFGNEKELRFAILEQEKSQSSTSSTCSAVPPPATNSNLLKAPLGRLPSYPSTEVGSPVKQPPVSSVSAPQDPPPCPPRSSKGAPPPPPPRTSSSTSKAALSKVIKSLHQVCSPPLSSLMYVPFHRRMLVLLVQIMVKD